VLKNEQIFSKEGMNYLWYSLKLGGNKSRDMIYENARVKLTLSSKNEHSLKVASLSLWLLSHFGGMGSRNRRGAGNFLIKNIYGNTEVLGDYNLQFNGSSVEEYKEYITDNLTKMKNEFGKSSTEKYSNLSNAKIHISKKGYDTYISALDDIGTKLRNFRYKYENHQKDYKVVKDYLRGYKLDKPCTVEKAGFGLPLMYRYRSLGGKSATITACYNKDIERRSSPLIVKLVKIGNKYHQVLIHLGGELLPTSATLKLKGGRNRPADLPQPEINIINKFIDTLSDFYEVEL